MMTTHASIGRQLLAAMISNDEAGFIRILDAHCLHIRGGGLDQDHEIARVLDQFREGERTLALEHDLAASKMIRSEMLDRLARGQEELLAA